MHVAGLAVVACVLLTTTFTAEAQPAQRVPRVGVLAPLSPPPAPSPDIEGFRQGLREVGYVEGQTIIVEYRWAAGQYERWTELVGEMERLGVDVIVVAGPGAAAAAKRVTSRIPIVMATGGTDPVKAGLAASLARPGGNVTGLSMMVIELSAKRVELLKEAIPSLSRIAVLVPPDSAGAYDQYDLSMKQTEAGARALGAQIHPIRVTAAAHLDAAFRAAIKWGCGRRHHNAESILRERERPGRETRAEAPPPNHVRRAWLHRGRRAHHVWPQYSRPLAPGGPLRG